jgi:ABC-type polysaccharide/polyol phosphate export permease
MAPLKEALDNREFLKEFTLQQLRSKYRNSVLGYLWALLMPLSVFATFTLIFAVVNRLNPTTYAPFFFAGYLPWLLFQNTASAATTSIVGNAHILTRIRAPKSVFPVSALLINLVEFAGFAAATLLLMALLKAKFSLAMLFIPVAAIILVVFVLGIAFLFATINVFFRDFAFFWQTASFLLFFSTPILFPLTQISPAFRPYFELNPILPFIRMFQEPISGGAMPSLETVVLAIIYAVILFVFGATVFSRAQKSFYSYL